MTSTPGEFAASFLTIIATVSAGLWLLPPVSRENLIDDARAASLYVANWRYADQATAYSDTEVTNSLLVHFWSLAIEEQFYVLWPILIAVGLVSARLLRRPVRPILGVLLGLVGAVTFALSVRITQSEGVGAYYLTHTRLWEMSVGAGLALAIHRIPRLPTFVLDASGAAGLAAIAYSAMTYDAATPFPGSAALVPVLGCAAVLIAGSQFPGLVARSLAIAPLRLVGRLSYAWYLFHWPVIGVGLLLRDRYGWGLSVGATTAASVAGSLGLAWIAHHVIENPVRHASLFQSRPGPNFILGATLTVLPLAIGGAALSMVDRGDSTLVIENASGSIELAQSPADAIEDHILADPACHAAFDDTEPAEACTFGDPEADRTLVLLGDSHARQWLDALDQIGREDGWRIHAWTKSACPIIDVRTYLTALERIYEECGQWRAAVTERVSELDRVDVLLVARVEPCRPGTRRSDSRSSGRGRAVLGRELRSIGVDFRPVGGANDPHRGHAVAWILPSGLSLGRARHSCGLQLRAGRSSPGWPTPGRRAPDRRRGRGSHRRSRAARVPRGDLLRSDRRRGHRLPRHPSSDALIHSHAG